MAITFLTNEDGQGFDDRLKALEQGSADSGENVDIPENVALLEDVTVDEASGDFIPMLSPNGTEYRLSIGDDGIPIIKNLSGATVWSGTSGGSSGGGSDGIEWVSGAAIEYTVTADEYVDGKTGQFVPEPGGFSRTDYIYCYDAGAVYYDGAQTNYAAFYDINKQYISGFSIAGINGKYANVPAGAAYFAISASSLDGAVIKLYKRVSPTWTDGEAYSFAFVENEYVTSGSSGTFSVYAGWKRTEYTNCAGASTLTRTNDGAQLNYGSFYNAEREVVTALSVPATADGIVTVPAGACYFVVSGANADMDALVLVPHA